MGQAYEVLKGEMPQGLPGSSLREKVAGYLASKEPEGYRPPTDKKPAQWAEIWANEMIPVASKAHARLTFQQISPISFSAKPREMPDHKSYEEWAGSSTRVLMQTGGWRLALVLETILK